MNKLISSLTKMGYCSAAQTQGWRRLLVNSRPFCGLLGTAEIVSVLGTGWVLEGWEEVEEEDTGLVLQVLDLGLVIGVEEKRVEGG